MEREYEHLAEMLPKVENCDGKEGGKGEDEVQGKAGCSVIQKASAW